MLHMHMSAGSITNFRGDVYEGDFVLDRKEGAPLGTASPVPACVLGAMTGLCLVAG